MRAKGSPLRVRPTGEAIDVVDDDDDGGDDE